MGSAFLASASSLASAFADGAVSLGAAAFRSSSLSCVWLAMSHTASRPDKCAVCMPLPCAALRARAQCMCACVHALARSCRRALVHARARTSALEREPSSAKQLTAPSPLLSAGSFF